MVENEKQNVQLVRFVGRDKRDVVSLLTSCDESGSGFTEKTRGQTFILHEMVCCRVKMVLMVENEKQNVQLVRLVEEACRPGVKFLVLGFKQTEITLFDVEFYGTRVKS